MNKEIQIKVTMKYYLTPVRMPLSARQEMTHIDKDMEKTEPLCFVGRKASWCIHYGKQHESSLKMKLEVYTQKNLKQAFKEIFVHSCS